MSGYGFGKKPLGDKDAGSDGGKGAGKPAEERLDFSGIRRAPVTIDPAREQAAIQRGDALGFVDRGVASGGAGAESGNEAGSEEGPRRRRRSTQPQINVFIKGPKDTLEWFIDYTNERGHRSYWQTLEEFRALIERQN